MGSLELKNGIEAPPEVGHEANRIEGLRILARMIARTYMNQYGGAEPEEKELGCSELTGRLTGRTRRNAASADK